MYNIETKPNINPSKCTHDCAQKQNGIKCMLSPPSRRQFHNGFFSDGAKDGRTNIDGLREREEGKDLLFFFGFRAAADNGRVDSEVGSQEHCVDGRYKKLPLVIARGSGGGICEDVIQKKASSTKKFRVQPCESALIWARFI